MAKSQALTMRLHLTGARGTLKAFNELGPEANKALKDANQAISDDMAVAIREAGTADSKQSAAVATTTRAGRDRVPNVTVGGTKKVAGSRVAAYLLLFGSNFGAYPYTSSPAQGEAQHFSHLPAGKGNDYWIFKTVEGRQSEIDKRWNDVASEVLDAWVSVPPGGEL